MDDFNSIINQEIKRKFVRREVYGCFTSEVTYILSCDDYANAPFTYDDIENYYTPYCADCGDGQTDFTEDEDEDGNTVFICYHCERRYTEEEYGELDTQGAEIYEWWAVSEYLAKRLAGYGHCIIEGPLSYYWGRECCGQAILLDHVISKICNDMRILDGQEYSWARLSA